MKKSGIIIALVLTCLSLAAWAGALAVARAGGLEQPTAGAGAWASSPAAGGRHADGALPTAQSRATPPPGVALTARTASVATPTRRGAAAIDHTSAPPAAESASVASTVTATTTQRSSRLTARWPPACVGAATRSSTGSESTSSVLTCSPAAGWQPARRSAPAVSPPHPSVACGHSSPGRRRSRVTRASRSSRS